MLKAKMLAYMFMLVRVVTKFFIFCSLFWSMEMVLLVSFGFVNGAIFHLGWLKFEPFDMGYLCFFCFVLFCVFGFFLWDVCFPCLGCFNLGWWVRCYMIELYSVGAGEEVILVPHGAIEAAHHPTGTGISLQQLGDTEDKEVGVSLCLLYPSLGVQALLLPNAKVPLRN